MLPGVQKVSMKECSSLRIGGEGEMIIADTEEKVKEVYKYAELHNLRVVVLGEGTNSFFKDVLGGILFLKMGIKGVDVKEYDDHVILQIGGGGGGGSGAIAKALVPIMSIPRTLFIQAGRGGIGGNAAGNGSAGERSYISIAPNTTAANIVMRSGNAAATGGAAGSTGGSATAGAAETISTSTLCIWSNFGLQTFIAGKIGAIGGVVGGGAGAANALLTASQMNGGAGGGTTPAANTNFAGGAQTGAGLLPDITGGTGGGNPGPGSGGYTNPLNVLFGYGGAGGGTGGAAATVGGAGGNGGFPGGGG
jgi:hypothetical protein